MSAPVTVLDLRGRDGDAALARTTELLADPGKRDLTRLLILESATDVTSHRAAFERLFAARRVDRHLCVVAGRQDDRHVLELPKNLENATLWLPDATGIDWPYRAATPAKVHAPSGSGFDRLVEIVQIPEVFVRTTEELARIPYGAACPAIGLADTDGSDTDDFPWALRAALEQMLVASELPLPPDGDPLTGRRSTAGTVDLTPNSRLGRALREARETVEEVQQVAEDMTRTVTLFGPAPSVVPALQQVADAFGALIDVLKGLMAAVRTREDPRAAAAEYGLVLPESDDFDADEVRAALGRSLDAWLRTAGVSLPQVDESLRQWARDFAADEGHQRRLTELMPARLMEALRNPVAFPTPQPWLAGVGAAVSFLVGTTPAHWYGGVAMGVIWTALLMLTVAKSPQSRVVDHAAPLAINAAASLAAGVAGGVLAGLPAFVWGPALAVAAAVVPVALLRAWKERAKQWVIEIGVDLVVRARDDVIALLGRAGADWALLRARATAQDALSRFQAAVNGVTDAVGRRLTRLERELGGRRTPLRSDYVATVQRQLVDLVIAALQPSLNGLTENELTAHMRDAAVRAEHLFETWDRHVAAQGAVEPPPFARDQDEAPAPDTSAELERLTAAAGADPLGEMWQQCAAEDLASLEVTPHQLFAVRFGPRTGKAAFGRNAPPDTVWVSAVRAGVLRLTPLRPGTITWTWNDEADELASDLNGVER